MVMMSSRVDADEAAAAHRWAAVLGIETSDLLREALVRHLSHLASERDAAAGLAQPLTGADVALAQIADWGPAEDWSDWADTAG